MKPEIHVFSIEQFDQFIRKAVFDALKEFKIKDDASLSDEFMNAKDAAKFLNLAVNTIYEKTSEKVIPHYKHGNKIMFKRSELQAWVEAGKVATVQDIQNEVFLKSIEESDKRRKKR